MVFLTLSGVEYSYHFLPAEHVHDDHLCGDVVNRPGLGSADAKGRGLAAGEPVGYYCKLLQFYTCLSIHTFCN